MSAYAYRPVDAGAFENLNWVQVAQHACGLWLMQQICHWRWNSAVLAVSLGQRRLRRVQEGQLGGAGYRARGIQGTKTDGEGGAEAGRGGRKARVSSPQLQPVCARPQAIG
jgi:hypothetical protein